MDAYTRAMTDLMNALTATRDVRMEMAEKPCDCGGVWHQIESVSGLSLLDQAPEPIAPVMVEEEDTIHVMLSCCECGVQRAASEVI